MQAFFGSLQEVKIQVVIELLGWWQGAAIEFLEGSKRVVEVFLASLNPCRRVVSPAGVLAGIADLGGQFRIFLHPLFPVRVEI